MKIKVKTLIFVAIGLVVIAGLAYRFDWFGKAQAPKPQATSSPAAQAQNVKAYLLKGETLEEKITSVGTVVSNEEVSLQSEASGKVVKIYFNEGSAVTKGQLLLTLNDVELQAALKKAEIQRDLLEKKKARDLQLHARQGISDEELELITSQLDAQFAEIEAIKSQIDKTRLVAPFSGRIGLRYVSEGSYVTPSTRIAELIDYSTIKVDFAVPEKYMSVIKNGMKVYFTVAGQSKDYEAVIYAIEPKVEAETRTIQIRALGRNQNNEILPGAFANVRIVLNRIENAKMIPTQALIPELNQKKVFIVKEGKAMPVSVETGTRTESQIQITEGLSFGDTVITSGILQVRAGVPVNVTELN